MNSFKIFTPRAHNCSVPGCRGRDCYRISRSEGALHSLYLCRDCIALAYAGMTDGAQGCGNTDDAANARGKGENDGNRNKNGK